MVNELVRLATIDDLNALVELDLRAFRHVYRHYELTEAEMAERMERQIRRRLEMAPEWCVVLERDGVLLGSLMTWPSSIPPEEFSSWEASTDGGELLVLDSDTPWIYGVSLASLPAGGPDVAEQLMLYGAGHLLIGGGRDLCFFEARMPGLRRWARARLGDEGLTLDEVDDDIINRLAEYYYADRINVDGELVRRDPELRMYEAAGVRFERAVPAAYADYASLDYGVLALIDNPVPVAFRQNKTVKRSISALLHWVAQTPQRIARFDKVASVSSQQLILIAALLLALVSLAVTPFGAVYDDVRSAVPWVGLGIVVSEIVLTAGIVIMASCLGISWAGSFRAARREIAAFDWSTVAQELRGSALFWTGFVLSVIGGAGDGIVLIAGVGSSLPMRSWGLMVLPFLDLAVTVVIRVAIVRSVSGRTDTVDESELEAILDDARAQVLQARTRHESQPQVGSPPLVASATSS